MVPARRFALSVSLGFALALVALSGVCPTVAPAKEDELKFKPLVTLLKMGAVSDSQSPLKKTLEISFSVDANVPGSAKLEFALEYQATPLISTTFTMKGESRNSQKLVWKPEIRMPVDEFFLIVSMPKDLQSAPVKAEIEKRAKFWPANDEPWAYYYRDRPFQIGTEEEKEAEAEEAKKLYEKHCDQILDLNNEFMEESEEVVEGKKFVEKNKLSRKAFLDFVGTWMKKFAAFQLQLGNYPDKEPGLYRKQTKLWLDTSDLARMVARRCTRERVQEIGAKYGLAAADLKLPAVESFDANYARKVTREHIKMRYDSIAKLAGFYVADEAEEGEDGKVAEAKKDDEGGVDDEVKDDKGDGDAEKEDAKKDDDGEGKDEKESEDER